ncbi:class I SAM-dependent methyltransferase [Photobacterium rosenbergii]|uniref:Methyltransferase domain-containing protein n=1 Tax=Photobacterium rosenbergii TaxID=294936 RepID=A0ABU3ZES9_9GAMM|nr:methyltransferase domain-containing protein [Photobacterium rosenbergii]MDV5168616.1 methyltransferase domain-containing protein [Photobacterium rosenbergii]
MADELGKQPCVLDIGAGSGRDALWFAENGCEIYAVEPLEALREIGKQHTHSTEVVWLDDNLLFPKYMNTSHRSILLVNQTSKQFCKVSLMAVLLV